MRQIILDTETTGLRVEDNHRIIEIGCIELIDRKLTGEHYHIYINPEREIDAGAAAVHGITNHFLQNKPVFKTIVKEFMAFVGNSELIIHNAPFDLAFLNYELQLVTMGYQAMTDYCSVIDTLAVARKIHIGQRNSLDALCKRYKIDNSKRDLHGALLDANLLAQVYLAMTGGQGSFFDMQDNHQSSTQQTQRTSQPLEKKHVLSVVRADEDELAAHQEYLATLKKQGKCVWEDS